jgi:hypothetical protein
MGMEKKALQSMGLFSDLRSELSEKLKEVRKSRCKESGKNTHKNGTKIDGFLISDP